MAQENSTLDDISAVIGMSATVVLAAWFGGLARLYVPKEVEDGQLLVKLIGLPAAKRMTAEWGGLFLTVPRMTNYSLERARFSIAGMLEKGYSTREIARDKDMSPRRVQQICRELEQAGLIRVITQDKPEPQVEEITVLRGSMFPELSRKDYADL